MKKILLLALIAIFLFSFTSCVSDDAFVTTRENLIVAPDGNEYEFLANEGFVCAFGEKTPLEKTEDKKSLFNYLANKTDTCMFSCKNDPEQRTIVCTVPDSEWQAYYRKASLPKIDLSPDNCIRFEFIQGSSYDIDVKHMTCNEGIVGSENIKAFLADIRSQKTTQEANLFDSVKNSDGSLENCYLFGSIYGYFQDEPNLAIKFSIASFNDKAYSISFEDGKEYVLPEKWLSELTKSNP